MTLLLLLLACDGGGGGDSTAADDTSGDTAADGLCDQGLIVTYETFGKAFLLENCNSCHASTSTARYGAPEEVHFDTIDEAWQFAGRILARAGAEPPDMPPMGGTTDDDRALLRTWLTCAEPGT